jgi:N-acetyl-alpha-D-muramate 1-phosphate uridylyltransferase
MKASAQAIVLAAGRGERMRPLTDTCPKPLLEVRGKPLMQWPLEALMRGGFRSVVVNTAWLGDQIEARFANGLDGGSTSPFSDRTQIVFSHEGRDFGAALETAGGIVRALPLLDEVFWVAAGDVFAPDFAFTQESVAAFTASSKVAHILLVPNPAHNPLGDFGLSADGLALNLPKSAPQPKFTYSTIGLYRRDLFAAPYCAIEPGNPQGIKAALAPLLRAAMDQQLVSAQIYTGIWADIGTPERLRDINQSENGIHPAVQVPGEIDRAQGLTT